MAGAWTNVFRINSTKCVFWVKNWPGEDISEVGFKPHPLKAKAKLKYKQTKITESIKEISCNGELSMQWFSNSVRRTALLQILLDDKNDCQLEPTR